MPAKFTIKFECQEGLWFATSQELNCFIALRDLAAICADIPNIVKLADERVDEQETKVKED